MRWSGTSGDIYVELQGYKRYTYTTISSPKDLFGSEDIYSRSSTFSKPLTLCWPASHFGKFILECFVSLRIQLNGCALRGKCYVFKSLSDSVCFIRKKTKTSVYFRKSWKFCLHLGFILWNVCVYKSLDDFICAADGEPLCFQSLKHFVFHGLKCLLLKKLQWFIFVLQ